MFWVESWILIRHFIKTKSKRGKTRTWCCSMFGNTSYLILCFRTILICIYFNPHYKAWSCAEPREDRGEEVGQNTEGKYSKQSQARKDPLGSKMLGPPLRCRLKISPEVSFYHTKCQQAYTSTYQHLKVWYFTHFRSTLQTKQVEVSEFQLSYLKF